MSWQDLLGHYDDFHAALYRSQIVSRGARQTLGNFPARLAPDQRRALRAGMREFGASLMKAARIAKRLAGSSRRKHIDVSPRASRVSKEHAPLVAAVIMLLVITFRRSPGPFKLETINVDRLLYEQVLIVSLAQLEAFLGNCVREMCLTRPEALCSGKPITREEVVKAGSWDALLAHLVEAQTAEFASVSLAKRFEALREKYGLRLTLDAAEVAALDELVAVRNVILHNGGRVDREYLRRTGRSELMVGDHIPIDHDMAEKADDLVSMGACDVLLAVGERYFAAEPPTSSGVMLHDTVLERRKLRPGAGQ